MATTDTHGFSSFAEFYPYYLSEHLSLIHI